MSTEPAAHDRRSRRRVALLWFAGAVAAVVLFAAGAVTVGEWHGGRATTVSADGTGSAPVLDAPPSDRPAARAPATGSAPGSAPVVSGSGSNGSAAHHDAADSSTDQSAQSPPRAHGVSLQLTSTLSAPLRPGFPRTLHVKVRNPNDFVVQLYRVDVRVLAPPVAGCLASWVQIGRYRYAGGPAMDVAAGGSTYVDLPIQLVNLLAVDQNACQNTAFPLNLSGIAVDPT